MKDIQVRLIDKEDFREVFDLIEKNRQRLITYFPRTSAIVKDLESAKKFAKLKMRQAVEREQYYFVVVSKTMLAIIGMVMVKNIDWSIPKGELAYFIDENYEGIGITSNAVKYVVEYCFEQLEMEKLYIKFDPENFGSKKVAIKNGFEKEGFLKREFRTGQGALTDVERYGLLKSK
jgi:RimJ/RimL family protein N-acetyltransferase